VEARSQGSDLLPRQSREMKYLAADASLQRSRVISTHDSVRIVCSVFYLTAVHIRVDPETNSRRGRTNLQHLLA
jgi:hypothetical protein